MDSFHKSIVAVAAAAVLAAGLAASDTATTKKPATKTAVRKSAAASKKSTPASKSGVAAKKGATATTRRRTVSASSKSKSKSGTKSGAKPVSTWHARQTQPTPERYKEIQQALVSKGYLTGEPTGTWNQQSIDALRRFQQDQKLDSTGKIDSLSLIALGLGPKHETASVKPPAPALPPPAPPSVPPPPPPTVN